MTDLKSRYEQQRKFSWSRVAANSAAIAVHVLIFMMLMAPVSGPDSKKGEDDGLVRRAATAATATAAAAA